jgi:hypothetical protein
LDWLPKIFEVEEEENDACVRDIVGSVKDFGDAPSCGPLCDWGATSMERREKMCAMP